MKILILLAALLAGTAHAADMRVQMLSHDAQGLDGFIVYTGESHIGRWAVEKVLPGAPSVNWGIGGVTVKSLNGYLGNLTFAARARAIVLWIGSNDVIRDAELNLDTDTDLLRLFRRLGTAPLVVVGVPAYDLPGVAEVNAALEMRCARRPPCVFLPAPDAAGLTGYHYGPEGYADVTERVRCALAAMGVAP